MNLTYVIDTIITVNTVNISNTCKSFIALRNPGFLSCAALPQETTFFSL